MSKLYQFQLLYKNILLLLDVKNFKNLPNIKIINPINILKKRGSDDWLLSERFEICCDEDKLNW